MTSKPAHNVCTPGFHEGDVARHWWRLRPGSLLPLNDGRQLRLLFAGRPGGSMGPDVCDAVFCAATGDRSPWSDALVVERYVGDVEFHIRASDWFVHGHHADPRYNAVILHLVSYSDDAHPTRRQDGTIVPVCSIQDLPLMTVLPVATMEGNLGHWSCHYTMRDLSMEARAELLTRAGMLRFEQKSHRFLEQLHTSPTFDPFDLYDRCLLPALAEALGYGRDRAFFRAVGLWLTGQISVLPEPLGHTATPASLDVARLRVLRRLLMEWKLPGLWKKIRQLLLSDEHAGACTAEGALSALRAAFSKVGLSSTRTDILICNVVCPFAAAVALLEQDRGLGEHARALYRLHPGLPSNRITRMMSGQLLLEKEPPGSCQQQGLHYIYQQTCREKRCESCLVGKRDVGINCN
jgi:hypothetical protein